jgi:hypothetical protein
VCKVCGFNIIGHHPANCPFCGASQDNFITAEECSQEYKVTKTKVNNKVYCLNSEPSLGLEHNAYKIETPQGIIWIDCPSTFDKSLERSKINVFTHHHFIAAANLYKHHFSNELWIHKYDSNNSIANKYDFDKLFETDFNLDGIHAFHIDGHTEGFTCYIYEDVLFVCDYIFIREETIKFNPYGPYQRTLDGAKNLNERIKSYDIFKVCGYDYFMEFEAWYEKFTTLID